jgi:nucleotide-binding universal stress UspA family protein
VGVDFTRASTEAARVALGLLAPGGTVTLAYAPGVLVSTQEEGERHIHDLGVEAAFDALVRTLDAAPDVTFERTRLDPTVPHPSAAHRLLAFAEETQADLIVLGSRRHGRVERWMLGSVTTDVARDGRISVLAVPPNE